MSNRIRLSLITVAGVIGVLSVVGARMQQGGQNPPPADPQPAFSVGFNDQAVPMDQIQLYQNIATTLSGFNQVPNDRLTYYSAVNNNNNCTIVGWGGFITGIQPNCNGYLVSVLVTPSLSSPVYGGAAIVIGADYTEQYQVNNDGSFQYLNSLDPQGLAGQMPDLMCQ
jgi:hypothetical protein